VSVLGETMELRFGASLVVVVGRLRGLGVECSRLNRDSRGPRSCDLKDRVVLARSVVISVRLVV
jgi:hypothetical protein